MLIQTATELKGGMAQLAELIHLLGQEQQILMTKLQQGGGVTGWSNPGTLSNVGALEEKK